MANEMNMETFDIAIKLTKGVVDNTTHLNGSEIPEYVRSALYVLIDFAAKNEMGMEDFHDTLSETTVLMKEISDAVYQDKRWHEWMRQDVDPTEDELHRRFTSDILPMVKHQFEADGKPDYPARCEAFNNWTDGLCKDGDISDWLYNNIGHPPCNFSRYE